MAVLRCPNCGKPNPDFLAVCQYCDQPLQGAGGAPKAAPSAPAGAPAPGGKSNIIRCPNCGKPNPSILAECQFCEQPLGTEGGLSVNDAALQLSADPTESIWGTPEQNELKNEPDWLWGGGDSAETPAASAAADVPDWLQGAAPAAPTAAASALPDWLQPASPPAPSGKAASNTPDWLSDAGLGAPAAPAEDDVPDWLRSLRGDAPAPTTAPAASAAPSAAPDWLQESTPPFDAASDDLPDWMQAAPSAAPAAPAVPAKATPTKAAAPADEGLPDWMRGEAEPASPAADDGLLDWMKPAAPAAAPAKAAALPPSANAGLPDWMRGEAEPAAPTDWSAPTSDDAAPDWRQPAAPATPTKAAAPAADEGLPDWMRGDVEPAAPTAWSAPAAPAKAATPPPPADDGLPDWMRGDVEPAAPTTRAAAAPPAFDSSTPDWLSAGTETTPAAAPGGDDSGVPDWLRSGADVAAIAGSAAPSDGLPDWLAADAEPAPAAGPSFASSGPPDWLQPGPGEAAPQASDAFASPDWLTPGPEATSQGTDTQADAFGGGDYSWESTPEPTATAEPAAPAAEGDWLASLRTIPSGQKPAQSEDSPGWLQTLRSAPVAEPTAAPEATPGIEHAALPNWLEAMRPTDVEGTNESPDDAYQESVGVLAGIRGILRAEPVVAKPTKSTTIVHKITLTDQQSKQINLIESLLREAAEPKAVPKRRASWQPMVERLLVFAFILLAIVLPFFAPGFFPAPASIDQDTRQAYQVVEDVPTDGVAVVAFDYDVAQRGELDPGAVAIVSHLLRQNVRVLTLSTRPTGVGAAEAVLASAKVAARDTVSATVHTSFTATYESGFHYLNLGYLPGGPIGIANFTRNPGAVFTNDFARSFPPEHPLWLSARALKGVVNLNNVNLIVVIADTADGVRAWMEQAHSQVRAVPIVVVASASAEPLVRPYLVGWDADKPIDGLVVGLAGAAKYELQSGQPGTAQRDWGPVSGGLLAAAMLLVGGNLVFGSLNLLRRLRRN